MQEFGQKKILLSPEIYLQDLCHQEPGQLNNINRP